MSKEATLRGLIREIIENDCFTEELEFNEKGLDNILKLISKEIKKNRPKEMEYVEMTNFKGKDADLYNQRKDGYQQALSDYNKVIADTLK